jgi:NitT/TauT family transport system permease protein
MNKNSLFKKSWGEATALLNRQRKFGWVDVLVVSGLAGLLFSVVDLAHEWTGHIRPSIDIDLSVWALPHYVFYSLSRGLLAYSISLCFALIYGYWAAKDHKAERVLLPLLDILQSIPVLGFMPGLVLTLCALFPRSNVGLELSAVIMIFTGQAWNMTFSFYHSLRTVPQDMREVATVYRFSWWQRFKWVELPYSTIGLVWNSMMSMAGGWFFLMINEAFRLGDRDFRLPGIGSYMSVAVEHGRIDAMLTAIFAMVVMILILDQVLWRPVVVWAQKFRVEEGSQQSVDSSWFLDRLRRSHLLQLAGSMLRRFKQNRTHSRVSAARESMGNHKTGFAAKVLSNIIPAILLISMGYGAWKLYHLLYAIRLAEWHGLITAAVLTLARVLLSTLLGTLWALPAGLAIGLSPRLSRSLQPVVQVVASFPAPMLFPLIIAALQWAGVTLDWGSIVLMLMGTQWYILFNVIAGTMAIPADLKEASRSYRIQGWQKFRALYFPAVFPYLITGWVTAAGGAWNASIVAEFITFKGATLQAHGLGAQISAAAASSNLPLLAASILVMSTMVVLFNRTVWRQFYQLAERKFSLNK